MPGFFNYRLIARNKCGYNKCQYEQCFFHREIECAKLGIVAPQIKTKCVKKSDFTLTVILSKNISEDLLYPTGFYDFDFKF